MQAAVSIIETLDEPSLRPTSLQGHQKSYQKKVRFDSTAIDNEYKMRPRQHRKASTVTATSPQDFMIFPSPSFSASGAAANSSKRINSPSVKSLPAGGGTHEVKRPHRESDVRYSLQDQWEIYPQTQNPFLVSMPRTEPSHPIAMNSSAYRTTVKKSARSAAKENKASRRRSSSHVPPRVPDAPSSSRNQQPPPAPRPTRLPTPDLMDIDGKMFCVCDSNLYGKGSDPVGMKPLTKMVTQLEAARAHMMTKR
ncbi:hypothetical protein BKA65DRAFT_103702 [Rhexocercosporidium sp. MPI-PUGE-AT-0058]|nr:hypothetical protein BKA65DRAFT_103702 [Rhexocercosporidium sp. MPI-PUGE-AT-0058]